MEKPFHAFTTKFVGRTNVLYTEVGLSPAYDPQTESIKNPSIKFKAVWDTGASISAVTTSLVKKLDLKPSGRCDVTNTSSKQTRNTYYVNIYLPNKLMLPFVRVVECDDVLGDFEMLVGMDVISGGDFAVTNVDNKTTMSFRIPSIEVVDYVETANEIKARQAFTGNIEQSKKRRELKFDREKLNKKRKKDKKKKRALKRMRHKN